MTKISPLRHRNGLELQYDENDHLLQAITNIAKSDWLCLSDIEDTLVYDFISSWNGHIPQIIPQCAWKKSILDKPVPISEFTVSMKEGMKNIGLGYRLWRHTRKEKKKGRTSAIDPFRGANGGEWLSVGVEWLNSPVSGSTMGVPLGGIGSGSIGRGWRGDCSRWLLRPGYPKYRMVDGNQFSFRSRSVNAESPSVCTVMYPGTPEGKLSGKLESSWNWKFSNHFQGTYHALFPRAWTVYQCPEPRLRLQCTQLSPVIANNYRESCLPVAVFEWEVVNESTEDQEISLMWTWENSMGLRIKKKHDHQHENESFQMNVEENKIVGIELNHYQTTVCHYQKKKLKQHSTYHDPMSYSIVALNNDDSVSFRTTTEVTNAEDASELWSQFSSNGQLNNDEDHQPTTKGRICGALCYRRTVPAGGKTSFRYALAWHMPVIRFGGTRAYYRRYTQFYGTDAHASRQMAVDALLSFDKWNHMINAWQMPLLHSPSLDGYDTYKHGLFNELYYLVAGGSEWLDRPVDQSDLASSSYVDAPLRASEDLPLTPAEAEDTDWFEFGPLGKFLYLESLEYLMYNTYDVHWYASFALAMCWPELEIGMQKDVAAATLHGYEERWRIMSSGSLRHRKVHGAVPHDMGHPAGDPWFSVNSYNIQDISCWKDLNSKFILQTYRDYLLTNDIAFLQELWPVIEATLEHLNQFTNETDDVSTPEEQQKYEQDGCPSPFLHCMVENQGFPDQTYDAWSVTGCSAYCGGLWIACLAAIAAMAHIVDQEDVAKQCAERLKYAKIYYDRKLWSGEYYRYDSSSSNVADSIMSDQLAGNWYAYCCQLEGIVEPDKALQALKTIYEKNFQMYQQGSMGVVNGMRPNGRVDTSCLQSVEVWTGTCYSVAAHMYQMEMQKEAMEVAESVVRANYQLGYGFQTPEAWDKNGNYRAIGYMRPLSIWSVQWAIERAATLNSQEDE